ncbi:MAG TPA: carbamoyltransferase, partial [Myxococcota bacterium]|nr:carbamoyltransferase [Myxococcota bacterium]
MNILGISAFYHDSAAALVSDGRIVAAAQEERFTRIKHDPGYPRRAIDACLASAHLTPGDVDLVAFYEKPLLKLDRVMETVAAVAPAGLKRWYEAIPSWFSEKLRLEGLLAEHLGYEGRVIYAGHHESHAASAFFPSPFEEAATLTIDGVGEWTTNAIGMGRGRRLEMLREIRFPHSLGLLYSAFTQYLGFAVNEGEYKVMGLAPYGEPRFVDLIRAHLIDLAADGSYTLRLEHFDFLAGDRTINARFEDLFGRPARATDAPIDQLHMDIARSIQAVTEDVVLAQARHVRHLTGARHLCMAGGVALNSVANGKLLASGLFDDVYVQPAAGDAGGAIGAALVAWHHALGRERTIGVPDGMSGALLGPAFDEADVQAALAETGLTSEQLPERELLDRVAAMLADGDVVGWVQGRMEFGPRALGSRSILADPRRRDMQRRVNQMIKFREGFRPFAPAVLEEQAGAWFELDRPSPYMLNVVPVARWQREPVSAADAARAGFDRLQVARSTIPAVTHVDDSARVQTVSARTQPRLHALLTAFQARTDCPVLLNTSFNLKDEPIVASPTDAARTFLASGMDALVLGDHLVVRPPDRPATRRVPLPPVFPRTRTEAQLRTFGLGGGAILGALALLQGWWERPTAMFTLLTLAAALAAAGQVRPEALRP